MCPYCKVDLRTCRSQALTEEELQRQERIYRDIVFLLLPSSFDELKDFFSRVVGAKLETLRQENNLYVNLLEKEIKVKRSVITSMEQEYDEKISLKHYFLYLHYFGINFYDISKQAFTDYAFIHQTEEEIFKLFECAANLFIRVDKRVYYEAVSKSIHVPLSYLLKKDKIKYFMKNYEKERIMQWIRNLAT
jgi:hypothetical protein